MRENLDRKRDRETKTETGRYKERMILTQDGWKFFFTDERKTCDTEIRVSPGNVESNTLGWTDAV